MKKRVRLLAFLLSAIMVIGIIVACGNNNKTTTAAPAAETTAASGETTAAQPASEPEYTLIFSTGDSETNVLCSIWKAWADKVKEATNGRVEVEMHYNGELASTGVATTALQQGTVDVAFVATTIDAAFKLDVLSEFVPCDHTCQHLARCYTECMNFPDFAAPYDDYKVIVLTAMGCNYIATTKEQIKCADDLAGLTMGVCSSIQADFLGYMGSSGVFCEPNGEYTAFEKGVVDGAVYLPWGSMISQGWAEQLNYVLMMNSTASRNGILMSKACWESLPEDIQQQIDSLQDWLIDECDRVLTEDMIEKIKQCRDEYGLTYYYPTEEEIAEFQAYKDMATDAYIAKLEAEGIDASGFWEYYNELIKKYSGDPFVPEFKNLSTPF